MPVPKPIKGENNNEFVSRYIRFLEEEDQQMNNAQSATICSTKLGESKHQHDWRRLNFSVPISETAETEKDFLIRGIAINSTLTRNGVEFVSQELQMSAASLRNKPILKDHNNSIDSIVGRTTNNVNFNQVNSNVEFEAKIMDEPTREKIRDGRIQSVSVGAMVKDLEQALNDDGEPTHFIARGIDFVELSLVAVPADPNAGLMNAIKMSYDIKQKSEQENNLNIKMVEETKKVEEKVETQKTDSINDEVLKVMQSLSDKIKTLESKLDESNKKVEEKVETVKVEEKVDSTKGEVTSTDVEESVDEFENYSLEREGRLFSFSASKYPSTLKRLSRGEY